MIKLRNLICEIISEKMSYSDLMKSSDPERVDRASRIPARSLVVRSLNDREAWKFSYKTPRNENTTELRHQGFIYFFKEEINVGDNAMEIPCSVDCDCRDYKYRFSYANKQQDAGENGPNSLNKGLNYPSVINEGPGLCKHLYSLKAYLQTEIEGQPSITIEPEQPVVVPKSPSPDDVPPDEEPEEEQPVDPTQTPEPEIDPTEPTSDVENPTQTPQEPKDVDQDQQEEPVDEPEKNKKKLKETLNRTKISKSLDEFCKKNRIFIV